MVSYSPTDQISVRETSLRERPGFQVKCKIIGVLRGDDAPKDREILVVLDVRILYFGRGGVQELSELKFKLSFTSEKKDQRDDAHSHLELLASGLFRPTESSHAGLVYEPLPTADPAFSAMNIRDMRDLQSGFSLAVDKFPLQGDTSFCVAVLIQRRSGDDTLRLMPRFEIKRNFEGVSRKARDLFDNLFNSSMRMVAISPNVPVALSLTDQTPGAAQRWAAANGWIEYLNLFLERRKTFDLEDDDGRTPLSWAAGNGGNKVVEWLLEKGHEASAHKADRKGRSPLSWSVGNGQVETTRCLLARGEDHLSQGDNDGRTPLSWGAGNGCDKTVELLLNGSYKIDPDQPDNKGRTPLLWAARNGCHGAVISLLSFDNHSATGQSEAKQQLVDFDHKDIDGRTPLSWAAQNEHGEVIRILTEEGLQRHPEVNTGTPELPSWATRYFHEAVKLGSVSLVKLLIEKKIKVDNPLNDASTSNDTRTALCTAAENGHVQLVKLLLDQRAKRDFRTPSENDTPILFAVRNNREKVVEVLVQAGCDISLKSTNRESPKDVAIKMNYGDILRILAKRDEDGPLAETWEALNHAIDNSINATIVDFFCESDIQPHVREKPVKVLLEDPRLPHEKNQGNPSYRWIHFPANNMRWIEVLISKLYEKPTLAYHILSSERWVGRQHHGASGIDHARFMRPLCQSFRGASSYHAASATTITSQSDQVDSGMNLVLFMPYLHWDLEKQQKRRASIIKEQLNRRKSTISADMPGAVAQNGDDDREERLLNAYLHDKDNLPHQMHVRRTLDQYYYHEMEDTVTRDRDQVVSRYQENKKIEPRVLTMVDQLWLWVLDGTDERLNTIITCFPSRILPPENIGNDSSEDPDPSGFTDVLGHIKSHLLAEPLSVKTAYDLAGLIANKCSRVYLDIGTMKENLRFSEVYETAISNVMSEGMRLFDRFTTLTKAPQNDLEYTSKIINAITDPSSVDEDSVINLCKTYHDSSFHESDLKKLESSHGDDKKARALELLKKIGRIQILDITEEIKQLREVKDIQDELSIMSMLYEDQKKVLITMDSIIRSIPETYSPSQGLLQEKEHPKEENTDANMTKNALRMELKDPTEQGVTQAQEGSSQPVKMNLESKEGLVEVTQGHEHTDTFKAMKVSANDINASKRISKNELMNWMFETWGSSKHPSLPLEVVQVSIDEIDRMSQRARQANQALDFLVDLKQKQSNVLDARSARIQAEESLKMTRENERQGKTLMVFTVVTIIFLPLSFLAAFFAINITQFHRDAAGSLGLGYVSEIMFPISATITAVLIYVAFKVEDLLSVWRWMKKLAYMMNMQLQPALEDLWTWVKKRPRGGNSIPDDEEGGPNTTKPRRHNGKK